MHRTLKRLLNVVIVFLGILPLSTLMDKRGLFLLASVTLASVLNYEVLSFLILIPFIFVGFIYSKLGFHFLPAIPTILLLRTKNPNRILSTVVFLTTMALFSNEIAPAMVLAFLVLNFFDTVGVDRKTLLVFLVLAVVIFLPVPRSSIILSAISKWQTTNQTVETMDAVEEESIEGQTSKTPILPRPEEKSSSATLNKDESGNSKAEIDFMKLLYRMNVVIFITVAVLFVATLFVKALAQGPGILLDFFLSSILNTLILMLMIGIVLPMIAKNSLPARNSTDLPRRETSASVDRTPFESLKDGNLASVEKQSATNELQSNVGERITRILLIAGFLIGIVAIVMVLNLILFDYKPITAQGEGKRNIGSSTGPNYTTNLSWGEILKLSGEVFIVHSYLYIRKNYFGEYDHLTPFELLKKFPDFPILEELTKYFVKIKYALCSDGFSQDKIASLKATFQSLVTESSHSVN
ncbi:hypothetical protein [Fervidobacterium thailandense]|uniref:Uncharacterized protein n=1 Tax=Fervidobacterium thailandense TaxID=1008305 RepID=A0A1E3G310_9BACT|nr:hypothetical protein [Fervidobacterium thailandense]ODN30058.1 hypothetical protein A4H02_07725 [Fervidobacterium thailandense]